MKNVLFFDTSIGTLNIGDEIINEAIKREASNIFSQDYIMRLPSRTSLLNHFQLMYNKNFKTTFGNADLKFVCGTNLLYKNMLRPMPNWNINIFNTTIQKNSILFGVGSGNNAKNTTYYTKMLYKKVLSKKYIHSVRDEATKDMLESIGFKAIVTGCPTLWSITKEHCTNIPTTKSDCAIFTLTHYSSFRNSEEDKQMVKIIKRNYSKVYFWPQSLDDLEYLKEMGEMDSVNILAPNLKSFADFLHQVDCDYIGSRLHGGIFALQHKRRSIILAVDHRAREIKKNNNIPCIDRDDVSSKLEKLIQDNWETKIVLEEEKIEKWKKQFIK